MPGFGRKNISLHVSIATVVLLAGHAAAVLEPQQFHASFSPGGASEMLVTWVTVGNHAAGVPTTNPMCLYDDRPAIPPAAMRWRVDANTRTYQDGKCDRAQCTPWDGYVHTATLTRLPPLTTVFYRCGDDQVRVVVCRPMLLAAELSRTRILFPGCPLLLRLLRLLSCVAVGVVVVGIFFGGISATLLSNLV